MSPTYPCLSSIPHSHYFLPLPFFSLLIFSHTTFLLPLNFSHSPFLLNPFLSLFSFSNRPSLTSRSLFISLSLPPTHPYFSPSLPPSHPYLSLPLLPLPSNLSQEVDMTNLIALRNKHKEEFEKSHGVKLGFMSAFVRVRIVLTVQLESILFYSLLSFDRQGQPSLFC